MSRLLAIDPGTAESGVVVVSGRVVREHATLPNADLLRMLRERQGSAAVFARAMGSGTPLPFETVACEMVAHYGSGMAVGAEVFEAVSWIGRFQEAWESRGGVFVRVYRRDVKLHICGSATAKDGNVRQALLDLYGGDKAAKGTKKDPGPLYGVSGHQWQALAVAITAQERITKGVEDA